MTLLLCCRRWLALSLVLLVPSCSGPGLSEYAPKSDAERDILSVLLRYENAKTQCRVDDYLACLHEAGRFHFARGGMVSKAALKQSLPVFWEQLKAGDPVLFPMNREMITGNYIRTGRFVDPKITVNQNTASVTVTFTKLGWRLRHYVGMQRHQGQWLINRLDWETN